MFISFHPIHVKKHSDRRGTAIDADQVSSAALMEGDAAPPGPKRGHDPAGVLILVNRWGCRGCECANELKQAILMPYPSNAALPPPIQQHLPPHAQDIYREAFNHACAAHAGDPRQEEAAHRIAWAAVKRSYVKAGDRWGEAGNPSSGSNWIFK